MNTIYGPFKGDMKRLAVKPATQKLQINPETTLEVEFGVGLAGFYFKVNRKYFSNMLSNPAQVKPAIITRGEFYNNFEGHKKSTKYDIYIGKKMLYKRLNIEYILKQRMLTMSMGKNKEIFTGKQLTDPGLLPAAMLISEYGLKIETTLAHDSKRFNVSINDQPIFEYPYKFEGGQLEKSTRVVKKAQSQIIKASELELNNCVILEPESERTLAAISAKITSKLGTNDAILTKIIVKNIRCESGPFCELFDMLVQKIADNEIDKLEELRLEKFPADLRLYQNLFVQFAEKAAALKILCIGDMNETSVVTKQMLVLFILQAVKYGMRPTVLKLFNLNIEAQEGEQVIESFVHHDVCSIEELDLSKNPLWWSSKNTGIIAEMVRRQSNLQKLSLMTEQIPFFRAKAIREVTAQIDNYSFVHEQDCGTIRNEFGSMLIDTTEFLKQGEELQLIYDRVEQMYDERIGDSEIDCMAFSDIYFPEETLSQLLHFLLERMGKGWLRKLNFDRIKTSFELEVNILPQLSYMTMNLKELQVSNLSGTNLRTRTEMFNLVLQVLEVAKHSLQTLDLHNFGLKPEQGQKILSALESAVESSDTLEQLYLSENPCCWSDDCIEILIAIICQSNGLKSLDLRDSDMSFVQTQSVKFAAEQIQDVKIDLYCSNYDIPSSALLKVNGLDLKEELEHVPVSSIERQFSEKLRGQHMTVFEFQNADLDVSVLEDLFQFIHAFSSQEGLESLRLDKVNTCAEIKDQKVPFMIAKMVNLKELTVENLADSRPQAMKTIIDLIVSIMGTSGASLRVLKLGNNDFSADDMNKILTAMKAQKTEYLEELDLQNNPNCWSDDSIQGLIPLIRQSTSLKQLNIRGSNMSFEAMVPIIQGATRVQNLSIDFSSNSFERPSTGVFGLNNQNSLSAATPNLLSEEYAEVTRSGSYESPAGYKSLCSYDNEAAQFKGQALQEMLYLIYAKTSDQGCNLLKFNCLDTKQEVENWVIQNLISRLQNGQHFSIENFIDASSHAQKAMLNLTSQALLSDVAPNTLRLKNLGLSPEEGEIILDYLLQSNINSLIHLDLSQNDWWTSEACVQKLCILLERQRNLQSREIDEWVLPMLEIVKPGIYRDARKREAESEPVASCESLKFNGKQFKDNLEPWSQRAMDDSKRYLLGDSDILDVEIKGLVCKMATFNDIFDYFLQQVPSKGFRSLFLQNLPTECYLERHLVESFAAKTSQLQVMIIAYMNQCSEELRDNLKYMIVNSIELRPPLKTLSLYETGFSSQDSEEISSALLASSINTVTELYLDYNSPARNSEMFTLDAVVNQWAAFIQRQKQLKTLGVAFNALSATAKAKFKSAKSKTCTQYYDWD